MDNPSPQPKRAGALRRVLLVVCVAALVLSAVMLGGELVTRQIAAEEYEELQNGAVPLDEMPTALTYWRYLTPDFAALKQTNSRFVCWIEIPNTVISYPVVKTTNNEYYLNRTFGRYISGAGCLFFDYRCDGKLTGASHNIIYGHRMNNETMFGSLYRYRTRAYYDAHREIRLYTTKGVYIYTIVSVHEPEVISDTFTFVVKKGGMKAFIDSQTAKSIYKNDVAYTGEENFLTLSTCLRGGDYSTRLIIQAVQTGFVEYPEDYWSD